LAVPPTQRAPADLTQGVDLLEQAITYMLGSLDHARSSMLSRPSPCRSWDLWSLLNHMVDSFTALQEAAGGHVDLDAGAAAELQVAEPVAAVRCRAQALRGAWAHRMSHVRIAEATLPLSVVVSVGAVEVAVHGWDVAQSCGHPRPIPSPLSEALLTVAPTLVTQFDRPVRFSAARYASPDASPSDQLVAYLGRKP
jgi:uncharacterized protein (TIGR03086 family)